MGGNFRESAGKSNKTMKTRKVPPATTGSTAIAFIIAMPKVTRAPAIIPWITGIGMYRRKALNRPVTPSNRTKRPDRATAPRMSLKAYLCKALPIIAIAGIEKANCTGCL